MATAKPEPHLFQWRRVLLSEKGPEPVTRFVLLALSTFGDQNGRSIYPSAEILAVATGLSQRAVEGHLRRGIEKGWVRRSMIGPERGGKGWRRSQYSLTIPERAAGDSGPSSPEVRNDVPDEEPVGAEPDADDAEPERTMVRNDVPLTSVVPLQRPLQASLREAESSCSTVEPGEGGTADDLPSGAKVQQDDDARQKIRDRIWRHWAADKVGWETFGFIELKEFYPDLSDDDLKTLAAQFWREVAGEEPDTTAEEDEGEWSGFMESCRSGLHRKASP